MNFIECKQRVIFPSKHLAILFEGAWIFTSNGDDGIRARCPLVDEHECEVGLWVDGGFTPIEGLSPMSEDASYEVLLDGFEPPQGSFDSLFRGAIDYAPILYVPAQPDQSKKHLSHERRMAHEASSMRTVTVPLPNMIVADGVLITAEIDGAGIDQAAPVRDGMPRPVIDFIFVYSYCGDEANASVGDPSTGDEYPVPADSAQPTPHLIFKVFPTIMASALYPGAMGMDDAGLKCHTTQTFDTLRQSISVPIGPRKEGGSRSGMCDVSIYHGRGEMEIVYGISGLSAVELGLRKFEEDLGPDLSSCTSGGISTGP